MAKAKDSRVNAGYAFGKEYVVIFVVLAAFSGFHMWIFQILQAGVMQEHLNVAINLLMGYVLGSAALVAAVIGVSRYFAWTRPLRKLSDAAREVAKGDLSVRIAPMRKDGKKDFVEILFDDFNAMTEEIAYVNNNLQAIVDEKTREVGALQNAILTTMADLVEYRDSITGGHIERTQNGVKILLDEIKRQGLFAETVDRWDTSLVIQSAQLHDVGKIAVSDGILKKPGPLTKGEYEEMKNHALVGFHIIERIEKDSGENDFFEHAKLFALTHHEKWDGTGYPQGLRGDRIPLQGRIMAIVDVYDALISERPYKKAFTHEEAITIIIEGKGKQFDPILTDLFVRMSGV
jgi:HD-GYP domain-containing protein (c-di-GMP phosphodiesterase class II)